MWVGLDNEDLWHGRYTRNSLPYTVEVADISRHRCLYSRKGLAGHTRIGARYSNRRFDPAGIPCHLLELLRKSLAAKRQDDTDNCDSLVDATATLRAPGSV